MSGTDDTEELLRAAPLDPLLGVGLVSGLASKVDSMQARLRNLENVSFSESIASARDYFLFANSPNKKLTRTPVKYNPNSRKTDQYHTLPKRNRRRSQFIPKTLFENKPKQFDSPHSKYRSVKDLSIVSDVEKFSNFSNESFYSGDMSNMSDSLVSLCSLEKKLDHSTLLEIDTFLNNMAKSGDLDFPDDSLKNIRNNPGIGKFEEPDIASKYIGTKFYSNFTEKEIIGESRVNDENINPILCRRMEEVRITEESPIKNFNFIEARKDNIDIPPQPVFFTKENLGNFNLSVSNLNNPNSVVNITDSVQKKSFALPSLMELWSNASESKECNSYIEPQRLEEEKLRRQHCENLIQELQKKILEQQQKIAVAVQVDGTKDDVINKLRESCSQAENHYLGREEEYKREIQRLDLQLKNAISVNSDMKNDLDNYESRFEKMMKLLNDKEDICKNVIAENNNNKILAAKDIAEMKTLLNQKDVQIKELNDTHNLFVEMNKQITENYNTTHTNLEKIKEENIKLIERSNKTQDRLKLLEGELDNLKTDKNDCLSRIAEEKSRNSHLDGQKSKLQISLDAAYRQIDILESQKNDLKISYQKQVDEIIIKKATEFQNEFDLAQSQMSNQIRDKEKEIALQFARHLNKIEQHHQYEVSKLEQTQKQQIQMYKTQLNKSSLIVRQLEEKLASYKERRGEIAAQLHNVMQSQWQQALKIITNGDSNSKNQSDDHSKERKFENPTLPKENKQTNNVQFSDDQLQRYVKILLNKIPETSKPNSIESKPNSIESKPKPKTLKFDSVQDFEYPTSDRANENAECKFEKQFGMKPPWK